MNHLPFLTETHEVDVTFRQKSKKRLSHLGRNEQKGHRSYFERCPSFHLMQFSIDFNVENEEIPRFFCLYYILFVALALYRTRYAYVREINDFCSQL